MTSAATETKPRAWTVATRAREAVFNEHTKRAWTGAVLGAAFFTPMFWLSVAAGFGRLAVPHGETVGAYPAATLGLYFFGVVVAAPALSHTAGFMIDKATAGRRRDDAVVVFVGFGILLAIAAVAFVVGAAPTGGAFVPALWMFGLPLPIALGLARGYLERALESRAFTIAACVVAYTPPVLAACVLLGLYVGHATVPA